VKPLARSYLYVPGDAGRRLALAHTRGADAVIADLEDAVAPAHKGEARQAVGNWLSEPALDERWVRVQAGEAGIGDLTRVFGPGLRGVCMPKVANSADVEALARALAELEHSSGWSAPPVAIMPLIESAAGLLAVAEIASASRVLRLQVGELDLAADLGFEVGADEMELLPARASVVVASAAAGIAPPVGAVWPHVRDDAGLASTTQRLRRLGFVGRAAVHPAQLETIHRLFSHTKDEIAVARRVVTDYENALASGRGVLLDRDGQMVDEATVRRSRRVLLTHDVREEG
jgi:citrate lyase subunit beta/citryl-CoA lyase